MRDFDGDPNDAYILVRVFNVDRGDEIGIKFFSNPWSLYIDRVLDFRSKEGYEVAQNI